MRSCKYKRKVQTSQPGQVLNRNQGGRGYSLGGEAKRRLEELEGAIAPISTCKDNDPVSRCLVRRSGFVLHFFGQQGGMGQAPLARLGSLHFWTCPPYGDPR